MAIGKHHQANFETLKRAAHDGTLCVMECADAVTGKPVMAICAASFDGKQYAMVPLAKLFDGNPYEELLPPILEAA